MDEKYLDKAVGLPALWAKIQALVDTSVDETNLVHKTGDETITGRKDFGEFRSDLSQEDDANDSINYIDFRIFTDSNTKEPGLYVNAQKSDLTRGVTLDKYIIDFDCNGFVVYRGVQNKIKKPYRLSLNSDGINISDGENSINLLETATKDYVSTAIANAITTTLSTEV